VLRNGVSLHPDDLAAFGLVLNQANSGLVESALAGGLEQQQIGRTVWQQIKVQFTDHCTLYTQTACIRPGQRFNVAMQTAVLAYC